MSSSNTAFGVKTIANVHNRTKRTIQRMANKHNWPRTVKKGLGGERFCYELLDLPDHIKLSFAQFLPSKFTVEAIEKMADDGLNVTDVSASVSNDNWVVNHPFSITAPPLLDTFVNEPSDMKSLFLVLAFAFTRHHGYGKVEGFDAFCRGYNARDFAIKPEVYKQFDTISRVTFYRWEKKLDGYFSKYCPSAESNYFESLLYQSLTMYGAMVNTVGIKHISNMLIAARFDTSKLQLQSNV